MSNSKSVLISVIFYSSQPDFINYRYWKKQQFWFSYQYRTQNQEILASWLRQTAKTLHVVVTTFSQCFHSKIRNFFIFHEWGWLIILPKLFWRKIDNWLSLRLKAMIRFHLEFLYGLSELICWLWWVTISSLSQSAGVNSIPWTISVPP